MRLFMPIRTILSGPKDCCGVTKTPVGYCTRDIGHDGPCAVVMRPDGIRLTDTGAIRRRLKISEEAHAAIDRRRCEQNLAQELHKFYRAALKRVTTQHGERLVHDHGWVNCHDKDYFRKRARQILKNGTL